MKLFSVLSIFYSLTCRYIMYSSCEFETRSWQGALDTALCDKIC